MRTIKRTSRDQRPNALRRLVRNEEGAATVEAVLWIPFFFLLLALIVDASLLFNRQAQMLRSVQDANRAFSTGQLGSPDAVRDLLLAQYGAVSDSVEAVSVLDTADIPSGIIRTSLSIPARDLNSIGIIASLSDFSLTVTTQHYREF